MTTATIVIMIILGLIITIASFFISESLTKKEDIKKIDLMTVDEDYEFSDRERQIIRRKIEDTIANQARDILYETNESLSSMANEKTIALGDYAVAVCDEIEKNHKEVMFLYSMLEDKQKDIMKTVQAVDRASADVKRVLADADNKISVRISGSKPEEDDFVSEEEPKKQSALEQLKSLKQMKESVESEADIDDSFAHEKESGVSFKQAEADIDMERVFEEIDRTEVDFDDVLEQEFTENENSNDIILEMYRSGESIINIAKQLGLGVGEVKLVIDLYQGV